jgi:AraC-like DNA-binding protein
MDRLESFLIPDTKGDLYISYFGEERCEPGHQAGPAVRDHFLLVYIDKGVGIHQANGLETTLSQGESFLLFPNVVTFYKADMNQPWEYKWVGFSGAKIGAILRNCGITASNPVFSHQRPKTIQNILGELLRYDPFAAYTDQLFYTGILHMLLAELGRDNRIHSGETHIDNRIVKARNFIHQHYDKKITVSTVAEYIGMERSYFTKKFKAESGQSPYDYILEMRISRGKQLLEQTDIPVEHLALILGFNDTFHFSNYFRRRTGRSPLQYRKDQERKR